MAKKEKKLGYEVLGEKDRPELYKLLKQLFEKHHRERLGKTRIVLAVSRKWKPNADGLLQLDKCKKAGELERQLHGYDFAIVLNENLLAHEGDFTAKQLAAVLDHELCHCAVREDADGNPKKDAKERTIYRVRKHTIEEFHEIVERHGCYKSDVDRFFRALLEREKTPLLEGAKEAKTGTA